MKIYTLTLNPAYDVHAMAAELFLGHENLADISSCQAGGKGVNISRALHNHGVDNTAVIILGKDNCAAFKEELKATGLNCLLLERPGRIRENLTIHCTQGAETRISFRGFAVENDVLLEISRKMEVDHETIVTFTGSVPMGIDRRAVLTFLYTLSDQGAKLVLDSKSLTLEDIYALSPWLIKPNQEEISAYFGSQIESPEQALEKATAFAQHGVTNVMVSLGAQGAMLIRGEKSYIAQPPNVDVVSTIGAGDSSIAGFIAASLERKDPEDCLRTAVAYGTAACLTAGSLPPLSRDTARILPEVKIMEI